MSDFKNKVFQAIKNLKDFFCAAEGTRTPTPFGTRS